MSKRMFACRVFGSRTFATRMLRGASGAPGADDSNRDIIYVSSGIVRSKAISTGISRSKSVSLGIVRGLSKTVER